MAVPANCRLLKLMLKYFLQGVRTDWGEKEQRLILHLTVSVPLGGRCPGSQPAFHTPKRPVLGIPWHADILASRAQLEPVQSLV